MLTGKGDATNIANKQATQNIMFNGLKAGTKNLISQKAVEL